MVCRACRAQHHQDCPGGTWCDCQHLPPQQQQSPGSSLNWLRQG